MATVQFKIWVAVGADGYKACLGSGISQATARLIADEVHFPDGCYTLACVELDVPMPEAGQLAGPTLMYAASRRTT